MERLVPIFRVKSARETAKWYAQLGFTVEGEHQFADNFPLYLFLRRRENYLHLSEHSGDANPCSLVYFYVKNLEEVAKEFHTPIQHQPWGKEIELTDPDGNRLRLGSAPPDP